MTVLFTIELRVACDDDNKYVLAKHAVTQAALQAYAMAARLDDEPQVSLYSYDYENGRRDIPLGEFTYKANVGIELMSGRLAEALSAGSRKPGLRLIQGGRPNKNDL